MDEINDDEKIKSFLEIVNLSDEYITRTIYDGQKTFALDVAKDTLFIFDAFKDNYVMDFITPNGVKAIADILEEVKICDV